MNMAGPSVEFTEERRVKLAKFLGFGHWVCILPSFICLVSALVVQVTIEDKIAFIENYNGAVLPGLLVFTGLFGLIAHILSGKAFYTNRLLDEREKWTPFLIPAISVTAIIFLFEFISGIMCFVHISDLEESFNDGIRKAMAAYKNDATAKEQLDVLQMAYSCCGSRSYRDWFSTSWIHPDYMNAKKRGTTSDDVPFSCCSTSVLRPCIHYDVHENARHFKYDYRTGTTLNALGCTDRLMAFFEGSVLTTAGAIVLSLSFIQLVLVIGGRLLQTGLKEVAASGEADGPSLGYLFARPKTANTYKALDITDPGTEEDTTLDSTFDTTAETTFTQEDEGGERYVDIDAQQEVIYDEIGDPFYENIPPFQEPHDLLGSSSQHEDAEVYLANRFATSREQFELSPEMLTETSQDTEELLPPPPPPQPPPFPNAAQPSMSRVRSGHGSYMSMNISNSSSPPNRRENKFNHQRRAHSDVKLHRPSHTISGTAHRLHPLVIDFSSGLAQHRRNSTSPLYQAPRSPYPRHSPPMKKPSYARGSSSVRVLPEYRFGPRIGHAKYSPRRNSSKISSAGCGLLSSSGLVTRNARSLSPRKQHARHSPERRSFKHGGSYDCNHAFE